MKGKKSIFKKWWFWLIIVVVIIAAVASNGGSDTSKPASNDNTKSSNSAKSEEPASKITYDNFLKIKMGAKLKDVTAMLGEGTEESSSEIGGVKATIYTWNGDGFSNMNVTIENNIVTGKAQAGLMDMDAKVTLDKYNKIKTGMTYAQAKAILGEGQLTSQTKIMGTESIMYEWINKDGSNMNATFTGNKLDVKTQFELK